MEEKIIRTQLPPYIRCVVDSSTFPISIHSQANRRNTKHPLPNVFNSENSNMDNDFWNEHSGPLDSRWEPFVASRRRRLVSLARFLFTERRRRRRRPQFASHAVKKFKIHFLKSVRHCEAFLYPLALFFPQLFYNCILIDIFYLYYFIYCKTR